MLLHVRSNIPTNHTWQTSPKRDAHLFLRFRILPGPIVSRHKFVVPCPEILLFLIQRFPIDARYRVDVGEEHFRFFYGYLGPGAPRCVKPIFSIESRHFYSSGIRLPTIVLGLICLSRLQ